MLEVSKIINSLSGADITNKNFEPYNVDLNFPFPSIPKEIPQEDSNSVNIDKVKIPSSEIIASFPSDRTIIAIDSTSFMLGIVEDGVVGSVRISVVIRKPNQKGHYLERYGPYIVAITNHNRDKIYAELFKKVYGIEPQGIAPENFKMLDRIRNLLERFVQLEIVKSFHDSFVLLDGSLIGDTIANPKFFVHKIVETAYKNRNILAAISKFTNLTLRHNKKSIISLGDGLQKPIFIGPLNGYIEQDNSRYVGDIYVGKLTRWGQPFRIDVPRDSIVPHQIIFNHLSGLAGDYGYPEELKFAHSTCVHSAIEILELQASAIMTYHMQIQENLRDMIFAPF